MTTLKIKPGANAPTNNRTASKPPVRRADPAKRARNAAPGASTKTSPRAPASVEGAPSPSRTDARPRTEDSIEPVVPQPSQRNHKYDGTPRQTYVDKSSTPDSRAPAARGLQKGEFKRDEFVRTPRAPADQPPLGRDSTERKPVDRNARGHAAPARDATGRDTPRRGGKTRDGFEPGAFNRDRASNPMFSHAPQASQPDMPRLSKRMAELGLCSRREADEWISNGWVSVDGVVTDTLGSRVKLQAQITVSKEAHQSQSETVTILLNKPIGFVSGQAEDGYKPAVTLIHPDNQWQDEGQDRDPTQPHFRRGHLQGLAPAGRLDIDSTGLLVFTQDGRVARQLISEDSSTEKEYLVRVEGTLSEAGLKLLNHGLDLDGMQLKPAKVSWQNEDQLRFVLREGRKRQIRRMCELVGLHVVGLKRVRIGSVSLGKLPMGSWRYLKQGERF